jgi:hypothetical protein
MLTLLDFGREGAMATCKTCPASGAQTKRAGRVRAALPLLAIALALALAGCDRREAKAPVPQANLPVGDGVVRGKVMFHGAAPVMPLIEPTACHPGAKPHREETVIVNENGTLKNVLVYIKDSVVVDGSSQPPAELDQVDCQYVPHVLAIQLNQPLVIKSSDPGTMHNVNFNPMKNPPGNFGMTQAGQSKTISFAHPEIISFRCDVHPWMTSYVGVFENPWFAITGGDGRFEIPKLPAGQYTLVAWHEQYGQLTQQIEVTDDKPVDVTFDYAPPR